MKISPKVTAATVTVGVSHWCGVVVGSFPSVSESCLEEPGFLLSSYKLQSSFEGSAKKKGLCSFKSAVEGLACRYALAGNKWNLFLGIFNARTPYGGWDCSSSKAWLKSQTEWKQPYQNSCFQINASSLSAEYWHHKAVWQREVLDHVERSLYWNQAEQSTYVMYFKESEGAAFRLKVWFWPKNSHC